MKSYLVSLLCRGESESLGDVYNPVPSSSAVQRQRWYEYPTRDGWMGVRIQGSRDGREFLNVGLNRMSRGFQIMWIAHVKEAVVIIQNRIKTTHLKTLPHFPDSKKNPTTHSPPLHHFLHHLKHSREPSSLLQNPFPLHRTPSAYDG